jgi:LuxR family maltose regulon positive regulatory protein
MALALISGVSGSGMVDRSRGAAGMGVSGVRQQVGRGSPADGRGLDLLASKLHPPLMRPGVIRRSHLVERLAHGDSRPIVSVVAPGGYGKTMLLSQWAERGSRAFAWVSVDEADNDPRVLLAYVAAALDGVEPIGERVFSALASPVSSVPGSVVPRLAAAWASMSSPVVLILDDVHVLRDREGRAALSVLADHVPAGSRLVLGGRDEPPVRIARLRAEGKLLEIGPRDLSLTRDEAAELLRNEGLALGEDDLAELYRRTEGWPAGLYLAALSLRQGGPVESAAVSFGGDDRFVSEYLESEFLARISPAQRAFLTRTAVLERMCGPLCEAVLERPGAQAILADLARSNLLLVALDRRGEWYRYHHLFRDMLLAELERRELELIPVLRRRAAAWCLHNGLPEEALEYGMAAEDVQGAARLVEELWQPARWQGRYATIERWLEWLEQHGGIEGHRAIAARAAIHFVATGRPAKAERWADLLERWPPGQAVQPDQAAAEAQAALLRAMLCRRGIEQMRADAAEAVRRFEAAGITSPTPIFYHGIAQLFSGDRDGGDTSFKEAVSIGERVGAHEIMAAALHERALLAMARNQWSLAGDLAGQARAALDRTEIEEPMAWAVQARLALHRGDVTAARRALVNAQRTRHIVTYALPHTAVQTRIELARAHIALADLSGARTLIREVDELLIQRPGLGTLTGEARAVQAELGKQDEPSVSGASSLTAAELRLLPLLSTHLPYPEIGEELFLSRHTVKSQAYSLYRKLGASTRSQAVSRARQLGLLEGARGTGTG